MVWALDRIGIRVGERSMFVSHPTLGAFFRPNLEPGTRKTSGHLTCSWAARLREEE